MGNAHIQPSLQPICIIPSLGERAVPGPDGQALTVIRWREGGVGGQERGITLFFPAPGEGGAEVQAIPTLGPSGRSWKE